MYNMYNTGQFGGVNAWQLSMMAAVAHHNSRSSYSTLEYREKSRNIGDEEFSIIIDGIKSGKIRGDLELRNRGLDNDHLKKLVAVLLVDNHIDGLNLSKNKLDVAGIQHLVHLIKNNSKIKMINVAGNFLSESPINELLTALEHNYSITAMDVGFDCTAIEVILKRNQQIKHENLRLEYYISLAKILDDKKMPKVLSDIILSYYSEATIQSAIIKVHELVLKPALHFVYSAGSDSDKIDKVLDISSGSQRIPNISDTKATYTQKPDGCCSRCLIQ